MRAVFIIVMLIVTSLFTSGQDSISFNRKKISKHDRVIERMEYSTEKYLLKISKQELKLKRRFAKKDSTLAEQMFGNIHREYNNLKNILNNTAVKIPGSYNSRIDSMKTALHFLEKINIIKSSTEVKQSYSYYNNIQTKFDKITYIENIIKQRQQLIREKLNGFGLVKYINQYKRQFDYYKAQAEEYKQFFQTPDKIEIIILKIANKIPEFNQFFNSHSQLASLFTLPGNNEASTSGIDDLQTRKMVMEELQERTGSNGQDILKQSVANSQLYVGRVKDKLTIRGSGDDDITMPGFKPNSQKTKQFLKKLEYGTNIQSSRGSFLLPVSTDINLNVGYKINSRSVLGIASCYRMGWGKDVRHLHFTHEAVGFKTFCEVKFKGSFWISGSGEMNYRVGFKNIDELKAFSLWQKSVLAGVSKKYTVGNRINGKIQLLYDFLHSQQIPATQRLLFRAGYTF
jgi:hypothetical protein